MTRLWADTRIAQTPFSSPKHLEQLWDPHSLLPDGHWRNILQGWSRWGHVKASLLCNNYAIIFNWLHQIWKWKRRNPSINLNHWCTNPGCQIAWETKFCMVAPNNCGSLVQNLLHFTFLAHWILRWITDFLKICVPLVWNLTILEYKNCSFLWHYAM